MDEATLGKYSNALRKYTDAWIRPLPAAYDYDLIASSIGVPCADTFDVYLPGAHTAPFMHRLHFLKQLSTVWLTVAPDATHTRFTHAVGTAMVANRLLDRITKTAPDEAKPSEDDYRACLLAAFIHDAFHGPFGHSLDLLKDVFEEQADQKLDAGLLRTALESLDQPTGANSDAQLLLQVARRCVEDGDEKDLESRAQRLLLKVREILTHRLRQHLPLKLYLRDIIETDSALDADRIDYLTRDRRALEGDGSDGLSLLVEGARAVEVMEGDVKTYRLAFDRKHINQISDAIRLRRKFYSKYYESTAKLIVDDMICHAVYYVLRDCDLTAVDRADMVVARAKHNIRRQVLFLTDDDLVPALRELQAPAQAYRLFDRVRRREFFEEIWTWGMSAGNAQALIDQHRELLESISVEIELMKGEAVNRRSAEGRKRIRDASSKHFEKRGKVEGALDEIDVLLFSFEWHCDGSFRFRQIAERGYWKLLMSLDESQKALERFAVAEFGTIDRLEAEKLDDYPPVHISLTSHTRIGGRDDVIHRTKEAGGSNRGMVLLHTTGKGAGVVASRERISGEVDEEKNEYPLVLSAPPTLIEAFGSDLLAKQFDDYVRSLEWLP